MSVVLFGSVLAFSGPVPLDLCAKTSCDGAEHIGSKTAVQIRSHAQKFFSKLEKQEMSGAKGEGAREDELAKYLVHKYLGVYVSLRLFRLFPVGTAIVRTSQVQTPL